MNPNSVQTAAIAANTAAACIRRSIAIANKDAQIRLVKTKPFFSIRTIIKFSRMSGRNVSAPDTLSKAVTAFGSFATAVFT